MLKSSWCNVVCSLQPHSKPLDRYLQHYAQEGLTPCEKKSGGRHNNIRSFTYDDVKHAASFISNYAEEHALVLPGRVPGFRRDDIKLLPSSETKRKVYQGYVTATMADGMLFHNIYSKIFLSRRCVSMILIIVFH